MNPNTGEIIEGTDAEILEAERKAGVKFVPVKPRDLERVKAMDLGRRRAYAKRVARERARRKANRKRKGKR